MNIQNITAAFDWGILSISALLLIPFKGETFVLNVRTVALLLGKSIQGI